MKKKVLVFGFKKSGKAISLFLLKQKKEVFVIDEKFLKDEFFIEKEKFFKKNCDLLQENLHFCLLEDILKKNFDFAIISSGISIYHPICKMLKKSGVKVYKELEYAVFFLKFFKKIIAVTGTNGKTTTALLIEHILKKEGIKAQAIGNIGIPIFSYLLEEKKIDVLIIELSSFQLESVNKKIFDMGVILNIFEDHLDWHFDFNSYLKAKLNMQDCIKKKGKFFIGESVFKNFKRFLKRNFIIFDKNNLCRNTSKKLEKKDLSFKYDQNVLAAFFICSQMGVEKRVFFNNLKTFKRKEHRIEFVKEIKGIFFYNDSKSTNVFSTIYAVKKFVKKPVILIAGGKNKNLSFNKWNLFLKNRIKYIFLIGKDARKIKKELNEFKVIIAYNMQRAVNIAYKRACKNDVVLLSPGCASFDQFRDFKHRGDEFKKIVNNLDRGRER